jgi:hypothetical protein
MRNLTPSHLRCGVMSDCPSITQLEDGRLLIVGKKSSESEDTYLLGPLGHVRVGIGEEAIVISPDLLADYISQHVEAAVRAERSACAKIAEDDDGIFSWAGTDRNVALLQGCCREIATAIRSRGKDNG